MNPASKYATPTEQGRAVVGRAYPAETEYRRREHARAVHCVRGRGYTPEETARLLAMLGLGEVA